MPLDQKENCGRLSETAQEIFDETKSNYNFSQRDEVNQDGSLQQLNIEEEISSPSISLDQDTQTETTMTR